MIFYHSGPIHHCSHVPGPVAQYSAESNHNAASTTGMPIQHFMILKNEFLTKDSYVVPEKSSFIILG